MASSKIEAAQTELFNAETTWFHIFRTMIANGDTAKMGPHAFTVYAVIKAHTNFSTGRAFPSIELISEKSGISVAQIKRELKTLEEMDYVTKEKKGAPTFTNCGRRWRSKTSTVVLRQSPHGITYQAAYRPQSLT